MIRIEILVCADLSIFPLPPLTEHPQTPTSLSFVGLRVRMGSLCNLWFLLGFLLFHSRPCLGHTGLQSGRLSSCCDNTSSKKTQKCLHFHFQIEFEFKENSYLTPLKKKGAEFIKHNRNTCSIISLPHHYQLSRKTPSFLYLVFSSLLSLPPVRRLVCFTE